MDADGVDADVDVAEVIPDDPLAFGKGLSEVYEADIHANRDEEDEQDELAQDARDTPRMSEGDFLNPAQHFIFVRLKKKIDGACKVNSKSRVRALALHWIFTPQATDAAGIEFDPACQVLGARPEVVRARVAHQLWKAGILLSEPLPFLSYPPPMTIMSEISTMLGFEPAVEIAREAWYWPSIPVLSLRERCAKASSDKYRAALAGLTAEGYLAIKLGRVYFTSRNPSLLTKAQRERFSFSRSIVT